MHPNNRSKPTYVYDFVIPPLMEFTFSLKSSNVLVSTNYEYPHKYDRKNITDFDEVVLPKCWYVQNKV